MTGGPGARLPAGLLLRYALPAFVVAMPTIPVYVYLPTLYGVELGLGLAVTGLVLLAARLFDTVTDPVIGALSDRFAFRGSRRKPWIAAGGVVAGLGLVRLLDPPGDAGALYLLLWSVVLYGGWTMVAVPYNAWGAELSPDYDQRTRITSWREAFALSGIVCAGSVNAVAATVGWNEREAIAAVAWAAVVAGALVVPLLLLTVPDRPRCAAQPPLPAREWRKGLASLAGNRPFVRLIAAWFLNGLANGIPAALFFLYLEHGLGASAVERPWFVLTYFACAIAAIPVWQSLSGRFGKHVVWCCAMAAACAAFVTVPFIPQGGLVAFGVVCVVTGAALGADLALPPAIQADVIDYDELRTGRARAGLQFALWGMSTKLALAAAVGLALPLVEATGFRPEASATGGKWALVVIYAVLPVVIKMTAIAVVRGFPITAARHAIIRRRLGNRTVRRYVRREET
jgi:GPH family glycoside/pentoside/hexuronide:cation symporter